MHRTTGADNVGGAFTDNFEGTLRGTTVEANWLNAVQEEIISILTLAGIEPDEASNVQMAAAMTILLAVKAPLESPALTGVPIAPTAAPGTESDQIATTAFAAALGTAHANLTNPHSATSAATALRLMLRDAYGRVKVAAPVAADDVARLATVTDHAAVAGTEAVSGHLKVASDADMLTDNDAKVATPKKLRLGLSFSLGPNGYVALPTWMSGLIIQWGKTVSGASSQNTAFPLPFPTEVYCVVATASGGTKMVAVSSVDTVNFTVSYSNDENIPVGGNCYWLSAGK